MFELPTRPHPPPCACGDCMTWSKLVVSTPMPRRPRAESKVPLASAMEAFIAMASKKTGLTREQLIERAKSLETEVFVPPKPTVSRQVVLDRGIPVVHVESVFDREPDACDALRLVSEFLENQKTFLVLSGGVGVQKTGSACWALTKRTGRFVVADELGRVAGSKTEDGSERWYGARNSQLLVVDDLGAEYIDDKGWMARVITALVDHRYSHRLKTIITTNLTAFDFSAVYGPRTVERIKEFGSFMTVGGTSVRRREEEMH